MQLAWGIHYETMPMLEGMNNDAENESQFDLCLSVLNLLDFCLSSVV